MTSPGRTAWRVGFYVEVEVNAYDGEAAIVAQAATGWPWTRHHEPVEVEGFINRKPVTGRILSSQALMVKPTDDGATWTLATARQLAARLDQTIDDQGVPVDREATVVALLDLLREDR